MSAADLKCLLRSCCLSCERPSVVASSKQNKKHSVRVRLSDDELSKLDSDAKRLGTSRSSLVRALISLPIETTLSDGIEDSASRVLVLDKNEVNNLRLQVRRWGVHFDESLRALNIIKQRGLSKKSYELYLRAIDYLEDIDKASDSLLVRAEGVYNAAYEGRFVRLDASDERSI